MRSLIVILVIFSVSSQSPSSSLLFLSIMLKNASDGDQVHRRSGGRSILRNTWRCPSIQQRSKRNRQSKMWTMQHKRRSFTYQFSVRTK